MTDQMFRDIENLMMDAEGHQISSGRQVVPVSWITGRMTEKYPEVGSAEMERIVLDWYHEMGEREMASKSTAELLEETAAMERYLEELDNKN